MERCPVRFVNFIALDASNGLGREGREVTSLQLSLFPQAEKCCSECFFGLFLLKIRFLAVIAVYFVKNGVGRCLVIAKRYCAAKIGDADLREIGLRTVS